MSAPRQARNIQLVKIQPEERLAADSELNSAPSLVTNCREARGIGYRAATQVKGLSPEITHRVGGRCCSYSSRQNSYNRNRQDCKNPTGSETVARYQKDRTGTRETQSVLHKGVSDDKSTKDKPLLKALWGSDWCIVAKKQGNACGVKAPAGEPLERGHFLQTQDWITKEVNKTVSKTLTGRFFQKSRVRENLKHGSVRGLMASSYESNFRKRWL